MRRRSLPSLLLVAALAVSCSKHDPDPRPLFAVIPKGSTHEFWKAMHAGAAKAARENGVRIDWKSAVKEDEREGQIRVVEDFINRKVAGIVLDPLDNRALAGPVHEAKAAGIPVVILDSGLDSDEYVSFVATDNKKGGALAADALGKALDGRGKILVLRYQEGSASTELRESGFLEQMRRAFPGIEIVSDDQYGGATMDSAMLTAEPLLARFKDKVQGIFCPNESTTMGMLRALQTIGLAGKVKFVGFDSSSKLVDALAAGEIQALVVQNPFRMGELGVTTLVKHRKGETIPKVQDTGVTLATKENMSDPAIRSLLFPDLSELDRK